VPPSIEGSGPSFHEFNHIKKMEINNSLVKTILKQLDEVYPAKIDNQDCIAPRYENRDEVVDHLFYLRDEGLIEFKDWSSRTRKACGLIRIIIPAGTKYLKEMN
jgi:hypothetical protein